MHLAPDEGIDDLVPGDAGEVIGGDVAERIARSLYGVHLHGCELGEHVRYALQLRPVELQVLSRAEVSVAAIEPAGNLGQFPQLPGGEEPVRNRDAQHRGVALDVQAVAQPQRAELVFGKAPGQVAARLVAKLRDAFVDELLVNFIVEVHGSSSSGRQAS